MAVKHPGMYLPTRELQDREIPRKQYIMQEYKEYSMIVISIINQNHVNVPCMDWYLMVFVESLQEKKTHEHLSPLLLLCLLAIFGRHCAGTLREATSGSRS